MHVVRLVIYELNVAGFAVATWQDYDMPFWRSALRRVFGDRLKHMLAELEHLQELLP
jgi:hypothetical protein